MPAAPDTLDIQHFFPYRLALLAEEVSHSLAQLYADRFDLSRHEWRVIAVLAGHRGMTAKQICEFTSLDKMPVSRAVAALQSKALLSRTADPHDRRHQTLRLTASGTALHRKITPLALAREAYVLAALSTEERKSLDIIMDKLLHRARDLRRRG